MSAQPAKLLRLYVNEKDQYQGKPLHEAIVDRCRDLKIAGVTVFRALEGFGETAELHRAALFHGDQPLVILIVERAEKAQQALPVFTSMMSSGLVAVTDVEVTYVSNRKQMPFPLERDLMRPEAIGNQQAEPGSNQA